MGCGLVLLAGTIRPRVCPTSTLLPVNGSTVAVGSEWPKPSSTKVKPGLRFNITDTSFCVALIPSWSELPNRHVPRWAREDDPMIGATDAGPVPFPALYSLTRPRGP